MALQASSIAVGLPWGEMGNSEVGHMVMGAGKIIYQNFPRITLAIQNGTFFTNPAFLNAVNHTRNYKSSLHLMGLVSNGGVHAHIEHLNALLEMLKNSDIPNIYIHVITDGRDTMPNSGLTFVQSLKATLNDLNIGKIASIGGRYWAMDRNLNWDRVQKAYECMIGNAGVFSDDAEKALKENYDKGITDEFIPPAFIKDKTGDMDMAIKDNDAVIFFNFREDRARQLTKAFTLPDFNGFQRSKVIKNLYFVTMVEYEKGLGTEVAFLPERINWPLGRIVSDAGLKQFRIAETEKYAHVTYFFNGGNEVAYPGEERILVPSMSVSNFAHHPEMSVAEIAARTTKEIERGIFDLIVVNFANADMVGHSGDLAATIKAIEILDKYIGRMVETVITYNGALLITADHGNAEEKINMLTGEALTEHTSNPVPLWFVTAKNKTNKTQVDIVNSQNSIKGFLADIAPTIVELMGLKKPEEMTGQSLLPLLEEKNQA